MAITVTKEKNLVKVLLDGKTVPYVLDINTGIVYGLRGKAIKTVTSEVFKGFCPYNRRTDLARVIYWLTDFGCCSHIVNLRQHSDLLQLADSFDNLGITIGSFAISYYEQLLKDKKMQKDYIKYATDRKKENAGYCYENFLKLAEVDKVSERCGFDISTPQYDEIRDTILEICKWATDRELKCFLVNFVENGYFASKDGHEYSVPRIWRDMFKPYCEYCKFLKCKVTTKDNFLTDYARVFRAYTRQKAKIDQERFTYAMNLHKDEMEFEYGNFKVVIPTSPQDIKDEGMNMHHCVAEYAKCCLETDNPNRSYIVFVRHKDTPDKCYITCQIRNGRIGQYFLAYDNYISSAEDKAFYRAYQQHLDEHWTKE